MPELRPLDSAEMQRTYDHYHKSTDSTNCSYIIRIAQRFSDVNGFQRKDIRIFRQNPTNYSDQSFNVCSSSSFEFFKKALSQSNFISEKEPQEYCLIFHEISLLTLLT